MTAFKEDLATKPAPVKMSLAQVLETTISSRAPLRFTAYDGSSTGPEDALGFDLVSPRGTTYLATAPGELGLVRAYVAGDLEPRGVHPGDPYELLTALNDRIDVGRPSARVLADIVRSIGVEHLVPSRRRRRRCCPGGVARCRGCGTAAPATPSRSTTTTTSPTPSTSGCSDRR